MSSRDDHYELGREDAANGHARYKFQDPTLQERYNRGYDSWEGLLIDEPEQRALRQTYCRICGNVLTRCKGRH